MYWWIPLAATTAMSVLKSQQDKKAYEEQKEIEAQKTKYAGFTGRAGQSVGPAPSSANTMMQGVVSGMMMGQNMKDAEAERAAQERMMNMYEEDMRLRRGQQGMGQNYDYTTAQNLYGSQPYNFYGGK